MAQTAKLKYVGPFDEVSVPTGDGEYLTVKRNHQIEVPGELKDGLLAQPDNWQPVGKTAGKDED